MRRRRPKAWATDKNGRELHIRHAAAALGISEAEAQRAFNILEKRGVLRMDGKRIIHCGVEEYLKRGGK